MLAVTGHNLRVIADRQADIERGEIAAAFSAVSCKDSMAQTVAREGVKCQVADFVRLVKWHDYELIGAGFAQHACFFGGKVLAGIVHGFFQNGEAKPGGGKPEQRACQGAQ